MLHNKSTVIAQKEKRMNLETTIRPHAQTAAESVATQSLFLRRALQADTLLSGLSGLIALIDAPLIANLLGFSSTAATRNVMLLGIGMLAWAALAFWVSTRPQHSRGLVFTIIEGNLLWVVGSILLLVTGWLPLSTSGKWTVAIVADLVGLLAILQYVGWRRLIKR